MRVLARPKTLPKAGSVSPLQEQQSAAGRKERAGEALLTSRPSGVHSRKSGHEEFCEKYQVAGGRLHRVYMSFMLREGWHCPATGFLFSDQLS
jgi:hypothetical protein